VGLDKPYLLDRMIITRRMQQGLKKRGQTFEVHDRFSGYSKSSPLIFVLTAI
jgi:hypothetical protein